MGLTPIEAASARMVSPSIPTSSMSPTAASTISPTDTTAGLPGPGDAALMIAPYRRNDLGEEMSSNLRTALS
jgi:hypothetical protein